MSEQYFMDAANLAASQSKANGTHVGCVIVKDGRVVSIGVNGNAPGADDKGIAALDRDDRLKFAIHAEENAIINAAAVGTSIKGGTAYITHYPCPGCASKLKASGIQKIVYSGNREFEKRWKFNGLEDLVRITPVRAS